jgi:hypothetical protein
MKSIYLPEVTDCAELFAEMQPWNIMNPGEKAPLPSTVIRQEHGAMEIGPFVSVRGRGDMSFPRQTMAIKPSDRLLTWVRENVVLVDNDRMTFEILVQEDGDCLVIVNHSQIIGGYWLTNKLRVETLPHFIRRPEPAVA